MNNLQLTITLGSVSEIEEFLASMSGRTVINKTITLPPSSAVDGLEEGTGLAYHRKPFTSYDDEYIIEHAHAMKYKNIASRLHRTASAIEQRAYYLIKSGKLERKNRQSLKLHVSKGTKIHLGSEAIDIN